MPQRTQRAIIPTKVPTAHPDLDASALLDLCAGLGLTEQELYMAQIYVQTGNRRRAIQEAGYTNWWPKTLRFREAVHRLQAHFAQFIGIQTEQILLGLKTAAFHDPADIYEDDGASWVLKPLEDWPLEVRQCVQEIRVHETVDPEGNVHREVKVKFPDRLKAKELLGKYLNLWREDTPTTPNYTLVIHTHPEEEPADPALAAKPVQRIEAPGLTIELPPEEEQS